MRDVALTFAFAMALACAASGIADAQGTPEQREACTPDALKLCAGTLPDIARTTACMKAHRAELSPRCQAAFATAAPAEAAPAGPAAAVPKVAAAKAAEPAARRRAPIPDARYIRDPDAEVPYAPPRRVIAPPLYSDPGPPLTPGAIPYDELFNEPPILDPLWDPYLD